MLGSRVQWATRVCPLLLRPNRLGTQCLRKSKRKGVQEATGRAEAGALATTSPNWRLEDKNLRVRATRDDLFGKVRNRPFWEAAADTLVATAAAIPPNFPRHKFMEHKHVCLSNRLPRHSPRTRGDRKKVVASHSTQQKNHPILFDSFVQRSFMPKPNAGGFLQWPSLVRPDPVCAPRHIAR
jgi:hypothetical protein